MKKLLMIINPAAGMKQAAKYLADICGVFCADGYETVVAVTEKRDDGRLIAQERSGDADVVVAVGGDGTFNEVVAGVMAAGNNTPVGYIPAGTTERLDGKALRAECPDVYDAYAKLTQVPSRVLVRWRHNGGE